MMRRTSLRHLLVRVYGFFVTAISVTVSSCTPADQVLTSPSGLNDYLIQNYYQIDHPDSILEDLERGQNNLFSPVIATPENYAALYSTPEDDLHSFPIWATIGQYTASTDSHVEREDLARRGSLTPPSSGPPQAVSTSDNFARGFVDEEGGHSTTVKII